MTIKHCPLLGKQGAVTIVCRSGRKAPVRRGLEHELGFGGWPHPAAVPLSSLPPEYYQAMLAFLSIAQDMVSGEIPGMLQPELQLWKHRQPGFFW